MKLSQIDNFFSQIPFFKSLYYTVGVFKADPFKWQWQVKFDMYSLSLPSLKFKSSNKALLVAQASYF